MTKRMNKIARTIALTLTAGALTAGAASAQTVQRLPALERDKPMVIDPGQLKPVRRVEIKDPAGGGQAWPAVVAAGAAVVMAATEVAHRVTERWIDPGIKLPGRGGLANIGAYDR